MQQTKWNLLNVRIKMKQRSYKSIFSNPYLFNRLAFDPLPFQLLTNWPSISHSLKYQRSMTPCSQYIRYYKFRICDHCTSPYTAWIHRKKLFYENRVHEILSLSEIYRRPTCLMGDPSETHMPDRRPRHASSETHLIPSCLIGDLGMFHRKPTCAWFRVLTLFQYT